MTLLVALIITQDLRAVGLIGFFDFFLKTLSYYVHEKLWEDSYL